MPERQQGIGDNSAILQIACVINAMSIIDNLAEKKILAALQKGEFDDLPGQGRPLVLDDDSAIPEELRAGFRLLKNAGYLPAELARRKEIHRIEALLLSVGAEPERKRLLLKISLLKSQL